MKYLCLVYLDAEHCNACSIRLASGIPPAAYGSIEVRPVRELDAV